MSNLTQTQRQFLRKLAHDRKPVVQLGKQGLTPALAQNTDDALAAHELIKVKFMDYQDQRESLAQALASEVHAELVAMIGNIAVLYRQNPLVEKRNIMLPFE